MALSYVLEKFPDLLPSFKGLPKAQRDIVCFTQNKMQFNHGWFVQAEAPPGHMLQGFKSALLEGAQPRDIAFYFLHWFTDLAGACGTPLGGAEKFVLKFPHSVLKSFIWSVPYLSHLVKLTETETTEKYLQARWHDQFPSKPLPTDTASVARMRLAVMAQQDYGVIEAFDTLPSAEKLVLQEELALTGASGQTFKGSPVRGGPALLVYYSPAFLQQHAARRADCTLALHTLSRVFVSARSMWPLQLDEQGKTVTIQVGDLRDKPVEVVMGTKISDATGLPQRSVWVLERLNDKEGELKLRPSADLNILMSQKAMFCIVDFDTKHNVRVSRLNELRKVQTGESYDAGPQSGNVWPSLSSSDHDLRMISV
jgi:hypothetical protein